MLLEQFLLVTSTLATFGFCFAIYRVSIPYLSKIDPIRILDDIHSATKTMDPNTILAFIAGLVASISFLIYISSGSKYPLSSLAYHWLPT